MELEKRFLAGIKEIQSHEDAFSVIFDWIDHNLGESPLTAVGHRVVHGGQNYSAPVIVTKAVLHNLEKLIPLAPLDQPYQLAAIETLLQQKPGSRQREEY